MGRNDEDLFFLVMGVTLAALVATLVLGVIAMLAVTIVVEVLTIWEGRP